MSIKILLLALSVAAISSCSTTYRSGQTPDDVYFSPVRVAEEDYRQEEKKDVVRINNYREREIQMTVYDRRWRDFNDDYDYRYDPYRYGYSYGYYYNPYYCHYPVYITNVAISNPKNTVPRMTNLGSYNNTNYEVVNTKTGNASWLSTPRPYNNSNNTNSSIRRILTSPAPVNNSNNNTYTPAENNTRSYSPSSNNSSSGSGSSSPSGSGAPVSRPGRGG